MITLRELKEEKLRRLKLQYYQTHPIEWLSERFGEDRKAFEWSLFPEYKDHIWDGDKDPIAQAWQSIANKDWAALTAATGTSKTYFLSRLVFWFLDVYPDSLIVTSAPKQDQLSLHLWSEIGRAFPKFKKIRPEAQLQSLDLSISTGDNDNPYSGWKAKGFVAGVGADEDAATKAQGFHRENMLIICEETPGMHSAIMTAFKNTSTGEDNNIIVAVGNPDNEFDELAKFCALSRVKDFRVSAFDYPNVVCKKTIFPGAVGLKSIEQRREEYGENSPLFLSRVRGISPKQSKDALIAIDWIKACLDNAAIETLYTYNAAGIDVANSENGDMACVAYGNGNRLLHVQEFRCPNATHLAYNLLYDKGYLISHGYEIYNIPTLDDYNIHNGDVGVDAVGVGVATVNAFKDQNFDVLSLHGGQNTDAIPTDDNGVPLYKFNSLRAQMYWGLREDFRLQRISIHIQDHNLVRDIIKELTVVKFDTKSNMIGIEKKDLIKQKLGKSPNLADAIAYWNWTRKGYSKSLSDLPFYTG